MACQGQTSLKIWLFQTCKESQKVWPSVGLEFLAMNCSDPRSIIAAEFSALSLFYSATNGSKWLDDRGWLNGAFCDWKGITCDDECHVIYISLTGNNLMGTLPSRFLASLERLCVLELYNNSLVGPLPVAPPRGEEITVHLEQNHLQGPLPEAWVRSPQLVTLK